MAWHPIIPFWSCEAGAGRRTLAQELARQWSVQGRTVLLLAVGADAGTPSPAPSADPAFWVPRFRGLDPALLRNYLAGSDGSYARLSLPAYPAPDVLKDMLALLRESFEWTLVLAPRDFSPETLQVFDAATFLLWVLHATRSCGESFERHVNKLTELHFPLAFSQVVCNRLALEKSGRKGVEPLLPGWSPLGMIPEDPSGLRLRERVRELARSLEARIVRDPRVEETTPPAAAPDALIEAIKSRVQPRLLEAADPEEEMAPGLAQKTVAHVVAQDAAVTGTRAERGKIIARVLDDVLGLGPLEPLLKDPEVSEVMVNGRGCVYVEKKGKLHATAVQFASEDQLRIVIERIVAPIGRRVDEAMPLCDARLADGSRVNIVLPPLALDGATVTIRKFMARKLALDDLAVLGSLTPAMAGFLRDAVVSRKNILISGGTGSGKTTLLNALSSVIPEDERIVTIEDAAELKLQKPHVVRLESRPPNAEGQGEIPIRRLVINALRMRPDRIVVGECRGGEALDMLQAMNTGHDGSLTTVHANTPRDALGRLETLVLMAGMDLPVRVVREQIRSAIQLIVQQARLADGSRRVTSITEVTGMEGDTLLTQELFRYRHGAFEATGLASRHAASREGGRA